MFKAVDIHRITILSSVLFVLILISIALGFYSKCNTPVFVPSPQPLPIAPTPTIEWKTYTSTKYGFGLSYPDFLTLDIPEGSSQDLTVNFSNKDSTFSVSILATKDKSKTIQEYLVKQDRLSQTAYEGYPSISVLSTHKTTLNGYPVIRRQENWIPAGFNTDVAYFKSGDNLIKIYILPSSPEVSESEKQTYDQVLSTFKFLNTSH